jgi:hypothetical protein
MLAIHDKLPEKKHLLVYHQQNSFGHYVGLVIASDVTTKGH